MNKKLITQTFYNQLFTFFIKNGKKAVAKKLISRSLLSLGLQLNELFSVLLKKFILTLNVFIEIKTIRLKKNSTVVPFPISSNRRLYLIIKWLSSVIKNNKKRVSLSSKLLSEFSATILNLPSSETIQIKAAHIKKVTENKSNIHYRW